LSAPEIGQSILHYRVLRKLGQGGMGSVYLAEDTKLNRKVALKFLPTDMLSDQERLKRFEREAKTVAALNHPNIVTIYSVEEEAGIPFIAMEMVEGQVLSEIIPAAGLTLEKFFGIAIPMTDAVAAAHEKGITHRDLKPGNIMVNEEQRVKVLDFGLAKLLQGSQVSDGSGLATETLTQTGSALGTVTYMAPEQLKGKPPDQRADIFSLGIVLYQMVSGQRPFHGETSAEIISSILRDAPPPVTDLKIELPSHLGRIIKRCLEKNPSHRYQTAGELRNDLEELKREIDSGRVFEEDAKTKVLKVQRRSRRKTAIVGGLIGVLALIAAFFAFRGTLGPESVVESQIEPPTRSGEDRVVAVLPFDSIGIEKSELFADSLNEELTTRLTSLNGLNVVSRASAIRQASPDSTTREIGERLNAEYVVVGSVRWGDGDQPVETVRTTLQVIRVEDDIQVWSDSYDRQLYDDMAVQSEIAQHVVRAVGSTVLGLTEWDLPPPPKAVEAPELSAEAPPQPARPTQAAVSAPVSTSESAQTPPEPAESPAVRVEETPIEAESDGGQTGGAAVTISIELTTFAPEGILTVYADDQQILSESFRFEVKKGAFGRRKAAGTISAQREVPATTETIRAYLVVGDDTKLITLEPDFGTTDLTRLEILLNKRGELEAHIQ